ncbi:MAG: carboxy terminal-processing peptidase [Planctomycetaceae bacterium]|nr:carboxy terminal-processing peptidase [Planctomycetaceae bacterium]
MIRFLFASLLLISGAVLSVPSAAAEEFPGTVKSVDADSLLLSWEEEPSPGKGDQFEIFVEVPGVGHLKVGSGTITSATEDQIQARVTSTTGKIQPGHKVKLLKKPAAPVPANQANPMQWTEPSPRELPEVKEEERKFGKREQAIIRELISLLDERHFTEQEFDRELADRFVEHYIKALDSSKLLFLQSEIDEMRRTPVLKQLRAGQIDFAREWYERSVEIRREFYDYQNQMVDFQHDFTVDEDYVLDSELISYAPDEESRQERWRKLVKYNLLYYVSRGQTYDEARQQIMKSAAQSLNNTTSLTSDLLLEMVANSIVKSYDGDSSYVSKTKYNDFRVTSTQQLIGIGASLRTAPLGMEVAEIISGGPADEDGRLASGDIITAVGEGAEGKLTAIDGMRLEDAVALIRGKENTEVRLRVLRTDGKKRTFVITRQKVKTNPVQGVVLSGDDLPVPSRDRIGFLRIPSFYRDLKESDNYEQSSANDIKAILRQFNQQDVDLLVIDLRGNTGGSLGDSINATGLFLDHEAVLLTKDRSGNVNTYKGENEKALWDKPIVILVDAQSAGGAEIFAGALRDHGKAIIVGDRTTTGAGIVKNIQGLGEASEKTAQEMGMLQVATMLFYLPGGDSIQQNGVRADIVLPNITDYSSIREQDHFNPISPDKIDSSAVDSSAYSQRKVLKRLRQQSQSRVDASSYFIDMRKRIDRYLQDRQITSRSLNWEAFQSQPATNTPSRKTYENLSGINRVQADPYLDEVLMIALDYLAEISD